MNTRISLIAGVIGARASSGFLQPLLVVAALLVIAGCQPPEERVAEYVAGAEQYFEEENLIKAELEAKNALQIEPKNADARYVLARIAGAKNDFNAMAQNLRIAIESRPDFLDARARLGTLYAQAGAFELAEEQLVELENLFPEHPETNLLRARLLANKGELEQAAIELNSAINKEPDNIVAMGLLASLLSTTNMDEALVVVDEAIAKNEENIELQLLKIDILTRAGRSEAAEAAYRSLIDLFPDESNYRFLLAKFLADQGETEAVGDVLMAAIESDPDNQEAKLMLVRFVAATQGVEEAVPLLQDFVEQDPGVTELRMVLADQYLSDGDAESAKAEFQTIADAEGNSDVALTAKTRIAGIDISAGEIDSAAATVEEVLAMDPLNANANYLRGMLSFMDSNLKRAVSDLRSALREDPDNYRAQWLLARTHAKAGDLLLAEDAYLTLLQNSPINVPASLEYAGLLLELENPNKALEFLSGQIGLMPGEADLARALIGVLLELERYDDAIAEAQRIGATEGNRAIGEYFSAGVYQAKGQLGKASDAFRNALKDRPEARELLQGLVSVLAAQGKFNEARDYLEDMTERFPENLFIKTLLGQMIAVSGDKEEAREIFESTLTNQSDWLPAYAALAGLDADDTQAQIEIYKRGLEASPGNPQMTLLLGTAFERRGEHEKAIALYEEALGENPNLPIVANNLAALLTSYRQDNASFQRALMVASQLEDTDQPLLLDTLGWVHYRLGDHDQAQRFLERAVDGEPNLPELRYHLGMTYLAQNKEQLAIEQLRAATELPGTDYQGKDEAERTLAELLGTN